MAFLSDNTLRPILEKNIKPFCNKLLKDASYQLTLGGEYYQTGGDDDPKTAVPIQEKEQIALKPGQFALLITKETVEIPNDCIGFISIKAKVKFNGLVNVSGFHVDPGYKGKLIFSVFNAGAKNVVLRQGEPLFLLWLSRLDEENEPYSKPGYTNIDSSLITSIDSNVVSGPVLKGMIDNLKTDVSILKTIGGVIITLLVSSFVAIMVFLVKTPAPIAINQSPQEQKEYYNENVDKTRTEKVGDSISKPRISKDDSLYLRERE